MGYEWVRFGALSKAWTSVVTKMGHSLPAEGVDLRVTNREVRYTSYGPHPNLLSSMIVSFYPPELLDGKRRVEPRLYGNISPFFAEEVKRVFELYQVPCFQTPHYYEQFPSLLQQDETSTTVLQANTLHFNFAVTAENIGLLFKVFNHLNDQYKNQPFPPALYEELRTLVVETELYSLDQYKHVLPERIFSERQLLLGEEDQEQLFAYTNEFKKMKRALAKGYNPNCAQRVDRSTFSPVYSAIVMHADVKLLELLLYYEANYIGHPSHFRASKIDSLTPLEVAFAFGQTDKLNLMQSMMPMSRPQKSPSLNSLKLIESNVSYQSSSAAVLTKFLFSNDQGVVTKLKSVSGLSDQEMSAVYQLFRSTFQVLDDHDGGKIKKLFKKDFSKEKMIDLILDKNKIIGFNLYEMIDDIKHPNHLFLHCAYAALLPSYRGLGLMPIFTFRMAYVLQEVFPEKEIGVFFCSIHYNSYRMVNFPHYPKFQTDNSLPIVQMLLGKTMPSGFVHQHSEITSYVPDDLQVAGSSFPQPETKFSSINEKIFWREILGCSENDMTGSPANGRAAPILFFANNENKASIQKLAANIGLPFDSHILEFAIYLMKCISSMGGVSLMNRMSKL